MSDFQKWSVLAFRAMDDAGRVLMTIEPESTTEGERLDQLKETIRELLTQALVLNGVWTRRQLDERFQFGKLDTDALNVQSEQQQAEPVAWMYQHEETGRTAFIEMSEHKDGWKPSSSRMKLIGPLYTTPPQRPWVGLTDEEITELDMEISGRTMDECVQAIEAKLKEKNDH